jgi:hypothetical protein
MKQTLLLLLIVSSSCNWAKQKTVNQLRKSKDYIDAKIDKVFPSYDADQPDTEHNKRRFLEHLQTNLTDDVNDICCEADFLGIDYHVQITFTCDPSTVERIIKAKYFIEDTTRAGEDMSFGQLPVTTHGPAEKSRHYQWVKNSLQYQEHFIYNSDSRQAKYLELSL